MRLWNHTTIDHTYLCLREDAMKRSLLFVLFLAGCVAQPPVDEALDQGPGDMPTTEMGRPDASDDIGTDLGVVADAGTDMSSEPPDSSEMDMEPEFTCCAEPACQTKKDCYVYTDLDRETVECRIHPIYGVYDCTNCYSDDECPDGKRCVNYRRCE